MNRTRLAIIVATALMLTGIIALPVTAAPGPIVSAGDGLATAVPLPTPQINGVVWTQAVAGNRVYVGGSFTTARPAGAAAGTNEVPRANLLAYDINTGALIGDFAPVLNGQVRGLSVSPDGTRVYVVGDFTTIDGGTRNRIAVFDAATGALIRPFLGSLGGRTYTVVATNDTVYVGGDFNSARGVARAKLAALRASDGALLGWAPQADAKVIGMSLSPDKTRMILAGSFATINGTPAKGSASVSADDGSTQPWAANTVVMNYGDSASMDNVRTDGTHMYLTGFHFGGTGNFEGMFAADPNTGAITMMEDCHGDTYDSLPTPEAIYTVGHPHYCGNVGGHPQYPSWKFQRALAWTPAPTGTINPDPLGYKNWAGQPAPGIQSWFPSLTPGTYTGQSQAAWSLAGNDQYVLVGGEFPQVNGKPQQGLTRFAKRGRGGVSDAPALSGGNLTATLSQIEGTKVRVSVPANTDRDDSLLHYEVIRSGAGVVGTFDATSTWWDTNRPGWTDPNTVAGTTYTYYIRTKDNDGHTATSSAATITVGPDAGPLSNYAQTVQALNPLRFWRLGEAGPSAIDWGGYTNLSKGAGITPAGDGAIAGDPNLSATFDGTDAGRMIDPYYQARPGSFTIAAWFKTTATSGGALINYGDSQTAASTVVDRVLYTDNAGKLYFGVTSGNTRNTVASPGTYRDGKWHQAVATLDGNVLRLYVDGVQVGTRTNTGQSRYYVGVWHVGGDNLTGWAGTHGNNYAGQLDDVFIVNRALTAAEIAGQYAVGKG